MITIVFIVLGLAIVLAWVSTDPRVRRIFYTSLLGRSEAEALDEVTRPEYLALLWAARVWVTSAYLALIVLQISDGVKELYPFVFWLSLAFGAISWVPLYYWIRQKT